MKKINYALALTLLVCLSSTLLISATLVDKIVAVVGNEAITMRELDDAYYADVVIDDDGAKNEAADLPTKAEYLEVMIQKKVVEQEVKRQGIRVDALEVERAVDRKRESMGLAPDQFKAALAAQGVSMDDYRAEVKEQLITFMLIGREVRGEIEVTDEEIQAFYNQQPELFFEQDQFHLLHLFNAFPAAGNSADRAATVKKVGKIKAEIEAGAEFEQMAIKYSQSPTAPTGGDLGWFTLKELLPAFRERVKDLELGQMTAPFAHEGGAHLILLKAIKEGTRMPLNDELRDKIRNVIYQQEAMERYDLWLERLKARTYVENRLKEN